MRRRRCRNSTPAAGAGGRDRSDACAEELDLVWRQVSPVRPGQGAVGFSPPPAGSFDRLQVHLQASTADVDQLSRWPTECRKSPYCPNLGGVAARPVTLHGAHPGVVDVNVIDTNTGSCCDAPASAAPGRKVEHRTLGNVESAACGRPAGVQRLISLGEGRAKHQHRISVTPDSKVLPLPPSSTSRSWRTIAQFAGVKGRLSGAGLITPQYAPPGLLRGQRPRWSAGLRRRSSARCPSPRRPLDRGDVVVLPRAPVGPDDQHLERQLMDRQHQRRHGSPVDAVFLFPHGLQFPTVCLRTGSPG